jgi:hypothetical protein
MLDVQTRIPRMQMDPFAMLPYAGMHELEIVQWVSMMTGRFLHLQTEQCVDLCVPMMAVINHILG